MVVGLRGYTQGAVVSPGASVAWPSGTVAGDLALVHCGGIGIANQGPQAMGWTAVGHKSWWKILTATDIASSLVVNARHCKLQTFTGAASVGNTSSQNGLSIAVVGTGFWLDSARPSGSIAPATYRLGTEWTDESGWTQAAYFAPAAPPYVHLPDVASGTESYSYAILPTAVPGAPTPLSPSEAEHVDYTSTVVCSWRHESTLPQTGFRLRMSYTDQVSGNPVTLWLTTPGGTPSSATETGIASSSQSVTVTPPSGAHGIALTWSVATQTSEGWSAYSARSLYADEAPVFGGPPLTPVSVTVSAGDLTPTIGWDPGPGRSGGASVLMTGWRIRVTPAASTAPDQVTLYDSGMVADATDTAHSVDVPATAGWTNGASYKAWVTIAQEGGSTATASSSAFTVSWTPTATPSISAAVADPPTVTVSGLTSGNAVQVEQRLDGVTWTPLASRVASGASLAVSTPLALTGAAATFRARQAALSGGAWLWSAWVTSAAITAPPTGAYLVDTSDPTAYLSISLRSHAGRGMVQGVATTYGLGAAGARVDYTPTAGEQGQMVLRADTPAERAVITSWLDAHLSWWIVMPATPTTAERAIRAARVSGLSWERVVQSIYVGMHDVPLSWVEQP